MIHQHILAAPRPGMSEAEFQDYWRFVHALQYAAKIPQIRKYKVDARLSLGCQPQELAYGGVAEIWIDDEKAQAASLQTPEFLLGAKLDEPRWAASWQTVVLDTEPHELIAGEPSCCEVPEYKLLLFMKRARKMSREEFISKYFSIFSGILTGIPLLAGALGCLIRDGFYAEGNEPPFDAVTHLRAESMLSLKAMLAQPELISVINPHEQTLTDPWGLVTLAVRSEWIVGPEARPYP
jgi:uncharacterized protein (TIGR02118 family)